MRPRNFEARSVGAWAALNDTLRDADWETCMRLLSAEFDGPRRVLMARRIGSRMNKLAGRARLRAIEQEFKRTDRGTPMRAVI
jgi:hypothetical protein